MIWTPLGKSARIVTRGGPDSGKAAARVTRVPPGHPEGYLEGFATIYSEVALAIKAARTGKKQAAEGRNVPDDRRRHEKSCLRRGRSEVGQGQRQMGKTLILIGLVRT
jgi:hypothetical protein